MVPAPASSTAGNVVEKEGEQRTGPITDPSEQTESVLPTCSPDVDPSPSVGRSIVFLVAHLRA